jgi:hypothetical protein
MVDFETSSQARKHTIPVRSRLSRSGIAALLALLLVSCGPFGNSDDSSEFWGPFTSQTAWEVGDGRVLVEFTGYERGHEPGRTAEFNVVIENRRDQRADLDVCAKLINEVEIVQHFDQFEVVIEPEESESVTFEVTMDEEIEPRAYGFAIVVGDIGSIVHTVRVGIPDDEAGPWLDADELVCD